MTYPNTASLAATPFSVAPFAEVRWGFIGVGNRGAGHVKHVHSLPHARVTALCDTNANHVNELSSWLQEKGADMPFAHCFDSKSDSWRRVIERDDVDAVVISTPWELHTPMALAAMQAGKHAFIEVPAAISIEECWALVDASEASGRHCMMLENANYGREELMLLNMCIQGLFGEVLHAEAAYIHELRLQMLDNVLGSCAWRTEHHATWQGNLYPTHGVGPLAHCLNVNRGDNFDYLVSMSSPARGRQLYARENLPAEHRWNNIAEWKCGDINTSIIKLISGKTMLVQWDETTPRPYSRHSFLQGTRGAFGGFPNRIALDYPLDELPEVIRQSIPSKEGRTNYHEWETDLGPWFEIYEHPLWKKIGTEAKEHGGHGGLDYIMLWRIQQCLLQGKPLDQSVYDAALWSSIGPLSWASVDQGSAPQKFPDFTRGKWKLTPPVTIDF